MLKIRLLALAIFLMTITILASIMTMPMVAVAQDEDVGTPPVALTRVNPSSYRSARLSRLCHLQMQVVIHPSHWFSGIES